MGYTTDFSGSFKLDKPLIIAHKRYLEIFSKSRRAKRNKKEIEEIDDPVREAVNLLVGREGEYFVGDENFGVVDGNRPPATQPSLYCQWIPSDDGCEIG